MPINTQVQLLNAIAQHGDAFVTFGENEAIWGSYTPEFEFVRDYFNKFRQSPSLEVLQGQFPDLESVEVTAPSTYYVGQLRKAHLDTELRNVIKGAAGAISRNEPVDAILQKLQTRVTTLGQFTDAPQDVNLTDLDHMKNHLDEVRRVAEENDGVAGIPTPFDSWNSCYTTGMAPGHVITMFGYSGKMKSMIAALLAVHAHDLKKRVMYVNMEMNPDEQTERLVALKAKGLFSMTDWSRGAINEADLNEWGRKNLLGSPDFMLITTEGVPNVTPNWISSKIEKYKPDIVFLDYLQLMDDNALSTQMTPKMMNLSSEIKKLATAHAIPIVQIAAVTDDENDKRDVAPQIKQISWSKGIEYNSNLAIAVHLHNDSGMVEVAARKNRRGDLFNCLLDASEVDRGIIREVFDV